MTYILGKTYT